jgi:hypothetical protein
MHVPIALSRLVIALTLIALPAIQERFGTLALPMLLVALAPLSVGFALLLRSMSGDWDWTLPAVDAASLIVLVPPVVVASGIGVADARLGGGAPYFAAACAAVIGATGIVAFLATLAGGNNPGTGVLALLPGPLVVAAVIAGGERFVAGSLASGLSLAWAFAALITLMYGFASEQIRSLLAPAGFAVFVLIVAVMGRGDGSITATNSGLALITTAITGAMLLMLPVVTSGWRGNGVGNQQAPPQ